MSHFSILFVRQALLYPAIPATIYIRFLLVLSQSARAMTRCVTFTFTSIASAWKWALEFPQFGAL